MDVLLVMTTVFPSLKAQFERSGFIHVLGEENLYKGVNDAIKSFENKKNNSIFILIGWKITIYKLNSLNKLLLKKKEGNINTGKV